MATREEQLIFSGIQLIASRVNGPLPDADMDITLRQWLVLECVLEHGTPDMSLVEISSYIGYSRQNVRKIAGALERLGLVEITPSKLDARAIAITPTRRAKTHAAQFKTCEEALYGRMFSGVGKNEAATAAKVMAKLLRNVDAMGRS
jgi:DNA-binding MarR family transcriptional regulator